MAFYREFFGVKEDYAPCMNKEAINRNARTWLQFYPHPTFVKLLRTLLDKMNGGNQSVWLTGPYGTGKSHAALVLQKLLLDDESRVDEWLREREALIPGDISKALKKMRANKLLVVFDSGSDTVNTPHHLLVRIERAIQDALVAGGCKIPAMGSLEKMISRVRHEGEHFFKTRDSIQHHLCYLTSDITNADEWEKRIRQPELTTGIVSDTMRVLEENDIYLDLSAENLIRWVNDILRANSISKLLFIWDEFSTYVEKHAGQLKTFETIAEASQEGKFFFVPVTHMEISAYMAAGSASAKKANDRFVFKALDMPTNTALLLGADAFEIEKKTEWENERAILWHSIRGVVENYMMPRMGEAAAPEDFKGILPIHPMAAFVLKHLATAVGSNQRSMFNYLKGNIGDSEFQRFIAIGGPDVRGLQFLTVDYLWRYFIERDDLGRDQDVLNTQAEYNRKSASLNDNEKRILKTVLLYSLLGRRTQGGGHELLQPTIENIVRSFEGDGVIVGVEATLNELAKRHCFSIVNGRCEMFRSAADGEELAKKMDQIRPQFNSLILTDKTQPKLESKIKAFSDKLRYMVQVSTAEKCTPGAIKSKDLFGPTGNKVLVYFILARDAQEQLLIPDKARGLSEHFKESRILFVTVPEATFCDESVNRWEEYVEQLARKELAADQASKVLHQNQLTQMEDMWIQRICSPEQRLRVYKPNANGEPFEVDLKWAQMDQHLHAFIKEQYSDFLDEFGGYNTTAMGLPSALRNWAKAGMKGSEFETPGAWKSVIQAYGQRGICHDLGWFEKNPQHPLTHLRDLCKSKLDNTVGRGEVGSLRKFYIDMQRPPFGLICVPYSAFVLGFVLREWLTGVRQLQWTDNTISKKLDADSLAEMIEAVVKDDGNNAIKNEKYICRLSKEEKAFIEKSGVIFGMATVPNSTVENTLQEIASRLEKISGKAPLWVLSDHIRACNDPYADMLCEIITLLCKANTISSKGNTEERSNYIKQIGEYLLNTAGIAEQLARYVKPDCFSEAFKQHVDGVKPEFQARALAIKDHSGQYCQMIKNQCAATAGWLWTMQNVEAEIETVFHQYGIIKHVQELIGQPGYMSFDSTMDRVKRALYDENKVSLALIAGNYPALSRLIEIISSPKIGDMMEELEQAFSHQNELLKSVFFDPARKEQISILKAFFGDALPVQGENELREMYESLSCGSRRSEDDFKSQALREIESFAKQSLAKQIHELWKERTGTESPGQYSYDSGIPAALWLCEAHADYVKVISNPASYTPERLKEIRKALEQGAIEVGRDDAQTMEKRFLQWALPKRYHNFGITAADLSQGLKKELGADPNIWRASPEFLEKVEKIIRDRYQSVFRQKALDKVSTMTPEAAKERLLRLVESIPDAGLEVLE